MSDGRPGRKPGTPSPFKKFWVIEIQGALVRFEGFRMSQLEKGPTPFEDEKKAIDAARHIWVGEPNIVKLYQVNRKWLDAVANGETSAKVQVYTRP